MIAGATFAGAGRSPVPSRARRTRDAITEVLRAALRAHADPDAPRLIELGLMVPVESLRTVHLDHARIAIAGGALTIHPDGEYAELPVPFASVIARAERDARPPEGSGAEPWYILAWKPEEGTIALWNPAHDDPRGKVLAERYAELSRWLALSTLMLSTEPLYDDLMAAGGDLFRHRTALALAAFGGDPLATGAAVAMGAGK